MNKCTCISVDTQGCGMLSLKKLCVCSLSGSQVLWGVCDSDKLKVLLILCNRINAVSHVRKIFSLCVTCKMWDLVKIQYESKVWRHLIIHRFSLFWLFILHFLLKTWKQWNNTFGTMFKTKGFKNLFYILDSLKYPSTIYLNLTNS